MNILLVILTLFMFMGGVVSTVLGIKQDNQFSAVMIYKESYYFKIATAFYGGFLFMFCFVLGH